ncbi:NAD-dependent epimerase/dehydratase [Caldithrix abyssi DSM 13497]|uniref:NAD-dependent epimerase/dehydratase n=1 Tax=Caldithrix abyssi DSM 13497 TaxID=880073 RepID=H1XS43_CALAY|nr:NAD-dependent epimerase/dehydratase family protein [Caldithrix abyssi]APF20146.1 UDP-2-acetamido-2,6-beta-L-arabino-hexul-4-ose reductase [Caldithrix abyssi DSM 13497]EHO40207.1 NAD-dependent epimerase/dehydratase [Caldithrix abyssi DSM 13497]
MKKIVITGQSGFIGSHLYNYLKYVSKDFEIIPFEDHFFKDEAKLKSIVKKADVLVHLAALNRHNDPDEIFKTNKQLVEKIINACNATNSKPHIIFASSTQEARDNPYGLSKKEGRLMFSKWAREKGATFTGLIIPNVFGPFGRPFYNSVVATFSYQLIHNKTPKIEVDARLKLIYVQELIEEIHRIIHKTIGNEKYYIKHTEETRVSEILTILTQYKNNYIIQNAIPELQTEFKRNLFNTFRSYIDIDKFYPVYLEKREDNRGFLVESVKERTGGQLFYSFTLPGITRGNHFHIRKIERFCVIKGQAIIRLRKIGTRKIVEYEVDGNNPAFIDIPIWYTHNITNIGKDEMITLFWSNEIFNPDDTDTFFEKV